jgi:RNA polymerase sigma factor for flagellar operon FliA
MHPYSAGTAPTAEERERLIMEHLPQVRLIARRIHERPPDSVSLEDLVSTGVVGLISAIDHFDPSLNVKLKTYAEYKIRARSWTACGGWTRLRGSSASGPSRSSR